ncbi:hypothetical protein Cco03nite_70370 [Catellatospora coxensis]|uniref:Uncharacterized protein n=1 Tax=Catellatospora coxensis TaxID=310354 RepID=A0A8J3PAY9_9ACTN|nr:hypothetical protein Cco03nite_70370 [Catellatospora coxensis]
MRGILPHARKTVHCGVGKGTVCAGPAGRRAAPPPPAVTVIPGEAPWRVKKGTFYNAERREGALPLGSGQAVGAGGGEG